ncbi:MAG: hypothetical protein K1000chlam2_01044 [Chlamydiae bacterium]|nr:hypothetical protein [Chlamydiota bacterium]
MDIAVALVFLFCLLFFGMRVKKTASYWVADRKTSLFALTATLVMTEFNTATLIAFSSMGYLAGKRALFLPLVFLIGLLFYAVTVAKKWKAFNGLSVASFFSKRYGRDIGCWINRDGELLCRAITCYSSIFKVWRYSDRCNYR